MPQMSPDRLSRHLVSFKLPPYLLMALSTISFYVNSHPKSLKHGLVQWLRFLPVLNSVLFVTVS